MLKIGRARAGSPARQRILRRWPHVAGSVIAATVLASCASPQLPTDASGAPGAPNGGLMSMLGSAADKVMESTGLKKPEVPDSALPDRRISWRVHASTSLNVTPQGQPLALLVRIYRLRNVDAFLQMPLSSFGDAALEKAALGDEVVSVREVQLVPGQVHESIDKLPRDIGHVGIVALYRQPAHGRWRYAFKAADAELGGLRLGAHACALSVQSGTPVGVSRETARSAAVACL